MASIICGVDISAATLDARIGRDGAWQQFAHTPEGISELAAFSRSFTYGRSRCHGSHAKTPPRPI